MILLTFLKENIMKKNFLYALALATTLVACTEDDYTDWANPQQNEQEALKEVSLSVTAASSIDFASHESEYVPVFAAPNVKADNGAEVTAYTITLNEKHTLDATLKGEVLASELETALIDLYGRRPTERTMNGLVKAYIQNPDGTSLVATSTVSVKATPVAPVIEDAYYLGGTPTNWSIQNADFIFKHSGADVYDDPIFTITVEAPVDENGNRVDMWFKIAPKSAFESGSWDTVLGCAVDGCTDLTGALVGKNPETGADPGALKMPATDGAKFYKIELNMMDYVYTISPLNFEEFIYVPGNHQGWSPEKAPALQSPNFDGVYNGYSYLNGNFKFTKARDWSAEYNFNDFTTMDDIFFNNDGSNINISEEGFYLITADIPAGKLSATKTSWGIIGPAQAGGWDNDTDMEWNAADESWTLTTELAADEFKFRANDGWDINFGGDSYDNLTPGGNNLKVTEAGTYEIKLFLTRNASNSIYCTLTKK